MTARRVGIVAALLAALASSEAVGADKLGVGFFAPEVPFANPAQRYGFVRGIAQHLSTTLGVTVQGRAYKTARDFERDRRAHKIHFAVIGPLYAAGKPGLRVLARARLRSAKDGTWSVMAKQKGGISGLKGKTIQVPNAGGVTTRFLQNAVLAGAVVVNKHFKIGRSPDVASAVTAVRVGRAQGALAPLSAKGLVPVVGGVRVPPPAFVLLDKRLDKGQVAKVTKAMISYGASGASIHGWTSGGGGAYRELAARSRKKVHRMVLAAARVVRLRSADLVEVKQLESKLPELEELFWIP